MISKNSKYFHSKISFQKVEKTFVLPVVKFVEAAISRPRVMKGIDLAIYISPSTTTHPKLAFFIGPPRNLSLYQWTNNGNIEVIYCGLLKLHREMTTNYSSFLILVCIPYRNHFDVFSIELTVSQSVLNIFFVM